MVPVQFIKKKTQDKNASVLTKLHKPALTPPELVLGSFF